MKAKNRLNKKEIALLLTLSTMLAALGYYILYPIPIGVDPEMHGQIVRLIEIQGYPATWWPYAKTDFTYPPLFHYLALIPALLGCSPLDSVNIIAVAAFSLIPVAIYFLVVSFGVGKRVGLLAAAFTAFIPQMANTLAYGVFPQVLSVLFLILLLYSINRGRHYLASVFVGLVVLAHSFMAIIAVVLWLYNFRSMRKGPSRRIVICVAIMLAISAFWIPKYFLIIGNAASGRWSNAAFVEQQPYLWFWSVEESADFLFGLHRLGLVIFPLSLIGIYFTKNRLLKAFYAISLAFVLFHLPSTQLKFLDLFVIPSTVLAAFGLSKLMERSRKHNRLLPNLLAVLFVAFLLAVQVNHFIYLKEEWLNANPRPSKQMISSSVWLRNYDSSFSRIHSDEFSTVAGIFADKVPLDPFISVIEAFPESYNEQIRDSQRITQSLVVSGEVKDILDKWDVKYILTKKIFSKDYVDLIHSEGEWKVYKVN